MEVGLDDEAELKYETSSDLATVRKRSTPAAAVAIAPPVVMRDVFSIESDSVWK
jgi:hypothetical protein